MSEPNFTEFESLLEPDGPVAIVVKQSLAPVNDDDPIIFPPSYPMVAFKGRVHTVQDGDYRVSVEIPGTSRREKNDKAPEQVPGYNIDRFGDGSNICEIDSPQSQANRIEPIFKEGDLRKLVPQIEIRVGKESVSLLDAGHRAGDAVVRFSSLADRFHAAFTDAKQGDCRALATLAPTSLIFGVWDSRSTQVKMQRILKASIRATNVRECTRSAQFTPAVDYLAAGAVSSEFEKDESDKNPMSIDGMKHALAVQKVGGVLLTSTSEVTRTVNLNLVALRAVRGGDESQTKSLQRYILGLSLLAATADHDLSLREGCHLRFKDASDETKKVLRRGDPEPIKLDSSQVASFALAAAKEFFECAKIAFDKKDHLDVVFESGVAEEFLGMKAEDRDKVRRLGPITAATLKQFHAQRATDPFKNVIELVKAAKSSIGKPKKGEIARDLEALKPLCDELTSFSEDDSRPEEARVLASELAKLAEQHDDSLDALKRIETKLKEFKKSQKAANTAESIEGAEPAQ